MGIKGIKGIKEYIKGIPERNSTLFGVDIPAWVRQTCALSGRLVAQAALSTLAALAAFYRPLRTLGSTE